MRRGWRRKKQAAAGLLAAVLLTCSLPWNGASVYAAGQEEEMAQPFLEDAPAETGPLEGAEDAPAQAESPEGAENAPAQAGPTEGMEDASAEVEPIEGAEDAPAQAGPTEGVEDASAEAEPSEGKEDAPAESETTQPPTEGEMTDGTENEKTQGPEGNPEEAINEGNAEKENVQDAGGEETDLDPEEEKEPQEEKTRKVELDGAYQFGEAPSGSEKVSAFSVDSAADTDTTELEEYLYQQMKKRVIIIPVYDYGVSGDEIKSIVVSVINENPDLYYVDEWIRCGCDKDNVAVSVTLTYDDSYDDDAFQKAAQEALAVVKPGMSDLEKAVVLHDYLALHCEYDKENFDKEQEGTGKIPDASYTAYGALVNRTAVCEGYALAYKYLLNKWGIDCLMVSSGTMNHVWNLVKLDGKYYQTDVTWDDPAWDRIGRARHEYMFRSDNAFRDECGHSDWVVTEGSEEVNYKASDTSYDNAFWTDCDSPLVLADGDCFYVIYDEVKGVGVINKSKLSDVTDKGTTVCDIGTWTSWDGTGFYEGAYSGLFYVDDRLYYNDKSVIYSMALDDAGNAAGVPVKFSIDTSEGYIYGIALCQGKVLYALHKEPDEAGRETVLTADITVEAGEPPEILAEKIELNQETLELVLGGKASLQAVVVPDIAVTWESSNESIAWVSDGTVVATGTPGSCTITASAGGKTATCQVIVYRSGGSYENITWKISAEGRLTVEGSGEFAVSLGDDTRAPWHDYDWAIRSAEIRVTDMTDASAMLFGCKDLASVDLSGFDTSKVTNMEGMFAGCENLAELNVSQFKTGAVTNMANMFDGCKSLAKIDVSGFDTSKVTNMESMFARCESLAEIDVSQFETGNVTNISRMFFYCAGLESMNLGSFDCGKVENGIGMLHGCSKLTAMDTPRSLKKDVSLPSEGTEYAWYMPDKTIVTKLPQNLDCSVKIAKEKAPETYITVQKTKTVYQCGDTINTDDLTVVFHDRDGTVKAVTDYTTDVSRIDMSFPGTKTLTVSYNGLTASVELTVTEADAADPDDGTCTVTFELQGHGTEMAEYASYKEIRKGSTIRRPASPWEEGYEFTGWYKEPGCQTLWDFEKDMVEGDTTLYAGWKSGDKADDKPDDKPDVKPVINSVLFPGRKSEYSAVYTGEQIRPAMTAAYQYTDEKGRPKTQKLRQNVDYTVRYGNNVNAGEKTAQVTVRGIGEYAGSVTCKFTITPKRIKNAALSPVGDIVFGGQPSVKVTDGAKELVEDRDYRVVLSTTGAADADTQSELTVEGIGNYSGTSRKIKFNILREGTDVLPITSENILVGFRKTTKTCKYNGKAQKPSVLAVDMATGKLLPSSMYKVIYSNNINAGKWTAKAWAVGVSKNGKGYYGISDPVYFDILQKDFKKVTASLSAAIPKTGTIEDIQKAIDEAIVVKDAKHVLSRDKYTIDYGEIKTIDDVKIGKKYPITLRPVAGGNYLADSQKVVNIKFGQLNLASRTAYISVYATDAQQNKTAFRYNGVLLEQGRDYTAMVKKEKNRNTYTVKIKAVKNSAYKGSKTFKNVELKQDAAGEDPGTPDTPEDPGTPGTPEDPDTPGNPDTPEDPDNPGTPGTPENPENPDTPENPDAPDTPENPGMLPAVSDNKDAQNYSWNWADTVKSYLYENQSGGLTRVECITSYDEQWNVVTEIVAEDYDDSFKLCESRKIPMELSTWGGFYAGDTYNFIIFGQDNLSEDDTTEVVRVVKYSKDWQRLGEAGLYGANTIHPFEAGSLRCAEYGDYLYIRTCHQMYMTYDGLNHQANMTLVVRQSDMEITDSDYMVSNRDYGYVSHSFNQFVLVDQEQNLVTADHGDANPRSIVVMRPENVKAGGDKFSGKFERNELLAFPGKEGDNTTGASVGGFTETKNGYVTAFNYDGIGGGGSRAVYLGFTDKSGFGSKADPITEYDGMRTPVLAPVGLDGGYVMWTDEKDKFYYTKYTDGGTEGAVNTADVALSDCQPILYNGAVVWYVTEESVPAFYKLDVSSSEISKTVAK